ncbi:MAG: 3-deoxy-D-manno-octulosonic acid kinase KdkA [Idiomarinaceae bacterium HL-53]|nr:MAG: 3-deoxy-D-manno-octulosonic acid kinase KdkA [Idiomarinaceae bacterium HL-53]CUS49077.1 3-deoxy-D-manno-octulosonic acid kinase [Idiomarinaceae bacterium HL-53]
MFVYHHIETEIPELHAELFTSSYWHSQHAITGTSGGRNKVYFVSPPSELSGQEWVLRHYYRGGVPGKVLADQFLFVGLRFTRAIREYQLLMWMNEQGLPVPVPVAAHVARVGLFYRADLLIERIPNAIDLGRLLLTQRLDTAVWKKIGRMLRRFHDLGISHVDLNCKNILWQQETQQPWLIDFDRCSRRRPQPSWQRVQIARLLRSFRKELGLAQKEKQSFHWQENDWEALITAYQKEE